MTALVARFTTMPRSRLVIAGLAILMTAIVMTGFLLESRSGYSGRVVKVVFFQSWPASRSVADVRAERAKEVIAAREAAAQSRAYIATLPAAKRVKAQEQYDAYIGSLAANLRPEGWVAPVPPTPTPTPAAATPKG